MRLVTFIVLVIYTLFNLSFAEVIQGEFRPNHDISELKEGDIVQATLRFWPIENADLQVFRSEFQKKIIFNAFYVIEISSLETSANNADVVELKVQLVVESAKPQSIHSLKYKDQLIELRLPELRILSLKEKNQTFFVLDQELARNHLWKWVMGLFLAVAAIAYFQRKKISSLFKRFKSDSKKDLIERYRKTFLSASERNDFERIYQEKEKWLPLLVEKTPAHVEFFKTLNQYQFKRSWSAEDLLEVKSSFEIIKRSFE